MAGRIGIVPRLIVAALLMCAGMNLAAHAEKRMALMIGNSAYRAVPRAAKPRSRHEADFGYVIKAWLLRRRRRRPARSRQERFSAKAGVPAAMNNLGLLYLHGKGVRRDYAQARRLFEQGSALGEPSAMNGLGAIYKDGDGVPRDPGMARQWFEKAAALGNPDAKQNLQEMRR
jgi:TPR repeat protein